ncbi:MAG: hypothetical protein IPJ17_06690 [Holophagales bacterium]|nr:MAG: hypothetical protein IPJ17_06690 [Holophagales bacterium]
MLGHARRQWLWVLAAGLMTLAAGEGRTASDAGAGREAIPPALAPWRDWALAGQEFRQCPFWLGGEFGAAEQHACGWPGELSLAADTRGGRFAIRWRIWTETWIPLPGDGEHRPSAVRVDGVAAPVVDREGVPSLLLSGGEHLVDGRFVWSRRPEALAVPAAIGRVDLVLDGQSIFPLQRDGASLWLGRAEAAEGQADSLTVQVYRKLTDELPPQLETRLGLDVSGRGREEVLGLPLPPGWQPTGIDSPLPTMLGADGRLRVQLRPGNWQIVLHARGLEPLRQVSRPALQSPWPAEEIWSFEARPGLRVAAASGGRPVDPSQVDVPAEWRPFPAFVVAAGDGISIEETSRGMAGDDANRLRLQRELWLDFSGPGLSARDHLAGRMVQGFRLDLAPPFALRRATAGGEPLLVTTGAGPGLTGVELRAPAVDLEASSRVEELRSNLPVTGWQAPFENVSVTLHLPPGRQLVAALGADASPDAWVDRWTLFDLFLLLVVALLAWRLLGATGGTLALVALGLAYHEDGGPLWASLAVLILALLGRALPAGRFATVVAWIRVAACVVLLLVALPFAARQMRLALYPQLETSLVYGSERGSLPEGARFGFGLAPTAAAPAPAPNAGEEQPVSADIELHQEPKVLAATRDESKSVRRLQRYAASNVFQAGGGEPAWSWRSARLSWSGPVLPEQTVRLWITPAWLTRALRVLVVALLALLLSRLFGALKAGPWPVIRLLHASFTAALVLLLGATGTGAQSTPDPVLLDQLRLRLLKAPECLPACGSVEEASVAVRDGRLSVTLTAHAATLVAMPVPAAPASWRIDTITVDGAVRGELAQHDGAFFLPLGRGVHRVELAGRLAASESFDLRFPLPPGRLVVDSPGWDANGRRDDRLLTDTLSLVRVREEGERGEAAGGTARIPPFVLVTRELDLDLDWSVTTRVARVAPREGSLAVEIPLLPGESVLTPGFEARGGKVTAAFGAGVDEVTWESRLERVDRLELSASDLAERAETWRVAVSPQWHVELSGLPPVRPSQAESFWVHELHPLPGETLALAVSRPEAVAGATLAIDDATLVSDIGQRASEHTLSLALRSTRGGQHTVNLPATAEVLEVKIDDTVLNLRPQQGRLSLPLHPGTQRIVLRFRDVAGASLLGSSPAVDLGAPASNLQLVRRLPANRWLLATWGPPVGPAVLVWGELAVLLLAAWALARFGRAPLSLLQWLLLGLGFATASWWALAVVVAWLLALEARRRMSLDLAWWRHDLLQLLLVGLTVVAMGCLIYAVPQGLLGSPDMRVAGNGSSAHELRWFADRTAGPLPVASTFTLPLFVFRLAMLAWALWLATSVVAWLRWGYSCLTTGGGWRPRPPRPAASLPTTPPPSTDGSAPTS